MMNTALNPETKQMQQKMFHIFRNTPQGREALLQSIYFCKTVGVDLNIYIPKNKQFIMNFSHDDIKIDLDDSYLVSPLTAFKHVTQLAIEEGIQPRFFKPKTFSASQSPIIPTFFNYMCCPRRISEFSGKRGWSHIGPKVRRIIRFARFPVLITSLGYKQWQSVAVIYNGSKNDVDALKLGLRISRASGFPLDVFSQAKEMPAKLYKKMIENEKFKEEMSPGVNKWHIFEKGDFQENLYNVPHDALVVLNIYRHSPVRKKIFGSQSEKIKSLLPNNFLVTGPKYTKPGTSLPT